MSITTAPRVLVVEDEPLLAQVLAYLVEDAGFAVEVVPHGGAAIERLRTETFGLVVTDLMMPEVNGERLVGWMRGEGALSTAVIVLSAAINPALLARMTSLGVTEVLRKPLDMDHFIARVRAIATQRA
jgi:two-component system phosphate regulon response regulator PhoB